MNSSKTRVGCGDGMTGILEYIATHHTHVPVKAPPHDKAGRVTVAVALLKQ